MTKKQQIGNIRAEAARHGITLKEITNRAELPYHSVRNAMHNNNLSLARINKLHYALNELINESLSKVESEEM